MLEWAKFAGWVLSPLPLALFGGALAMLLRAIGWRLTGMALAIFSFAGLWLASTPWCAQTLAHALERRYPALSVAQTPKADAALVLGGVLGAAAPPERPHFNLGPAADRVWHAAALYRAGKVRWVLLVGGNQPGFEAAAPEAETMREMLLTLGVPATAIRLETRSRNTEENARNSLALVRQLQVRRLLLVTSALHMPRAMTIFNESFRHSGVELLSAATDVETVSGEPHPVWQWLPDVKALAHSSRAIKEYLGVAYFRWRGSPA